VVASNSPEDSPQVDGPGFFASSSSLALDGAFGLVQDAAQIGGYFTESLYTYQFAIPEYSID
jgi:hypothetical protein